MPGHSATLVAEAHRVFCVLGVTASVLGLAAGLLLAGGGAGVRTGLTFMAFTAAGALIWTPVAWLPAWRRLSAKPLPTTFRLTVMAGVGALTAVPAAVIELLLAGRPIVVWFFVGVFGLLSGLLGAAALSLPRLRQR